MPRLNQSAPRCYTKGIQSESSYIYMHSHEIFHVVHVVVGVHVESALAAARIERGALFAAFLFRLARFHQLVDLDAEHFFHLARVVQLERLDHFARDRAQEFRVKRRTL